MASTLVEVERRLWDAADDLQANSKLKSSEYSVPVLGLIFLRYANYRFAQVDASLKAARAAETFDFAERLEELNEELEQLNAEAHELEERIALNVSTLLSVQYASAESAE